MWMNEKRHIIRCMAKSGDVTVQVTKSIYLDQHFCVSSKFLLRDNTDLERNSIIWSYKMHPNRTCITIWALNKNPQFGLPHGKKAILTNITYRDERDEGSRQTRAVWQYGSQIREMNFSESLSYDSQYYGTARPTESDTVLRSWKIKNVDLLNVCSRVDIWSMKPLPVRKLAPSFTVIKNWWVIWLQNCLDATINKLIPL